MSRTQWLKILGLSLWDLLNALLYAVFWMAFLEIVFSALLGQTFDWREIFLLGKGGNGHLAFALFFILPNAFAVFVALRRFQIKETNEDK